MGAHDTILLLCILEVFHSESFKANRIKKKHLNSTVPNSFLWWWKKGSMSALFNAAAPSHGADEHLKYSQYNWGIEGFVSFNLNEVNLNGPMWLVATILHSVALDIRREPCYLTVRIQISSWIKTVPHLLFLSAQSLFPFLTYSTQLLPPPSLLGIFCIGKSSSSLDQLYGWEP